MGGRVQRAQELDGLEILTAAVAVGYEVTLPAEIQIQHRGNGIDAQAVEVKFLEPVAGAREQEGAHFVPLVIEDQRAPVAVLALARGFAFVQRGAIDARQAVGVAREMPRHPVEPHATARLAPWSNAI